jgi:hypothetical protein
METRYVYNAERARSVVVAEEPSAANGYNLTLRVGAEPLSAAVIEWQVSQ